MELKQLAYFAAVAEEGSITAAARRLYMSQPPLSQQMQLLEKELGCVLFERGTRRIQLTDAGRLLYQRAQTMLEMRRTVREELRSITDGDNGVVRLGIVSSVVCSKAAVWIRDFHCQNPGVRFEITEANTYQLIEKLESGILQMAVIRTPYAAPGLESRVLSCERLVAVGTQAFLSGGSISPQELAARPMILYRRWEDIIRKGFAGADCELSCVCVADDARTCVRFAQEGMGIAIVPQSAADVERNICVSALKGLDIDTQIILLRRPGIHLPRCAVNFMDFIAEHENASDGEQ